MAFKLRKSGLPGICKDRCGTNLDDGRSPSSAFQMENSVYAMKKGCAKCNYKPKNCSCGKYKRK